jgi:hypothetical protein
MLKPLKSVESYKRMWAVRWWCLERAVQIAEVNRDSKYCIEAGTVIYMLQ